MNILRFMVILFLVASCTEPKTSIKDTPSPHPQVSGTQDQEKPRSSPSKMERRGHKRGEILVKFKDGTDKETIEAIQKNLHLKTIRVVSRGRVYLMKILDGSSVESVIQSLENYKEVQYSEPNYTRSIY